VTVEDQACGDKIEVALMNRNKALWEKGDFTGIGASMRESGEALVGTLGFRRRALCWI
jgi:hypothetical protein